MMGPYIKIVLAVPYKSFKERIKLVAQYKDNYNIEILDGLLYMEDK